MKFIFIKLIIVQFFIIDQLYAYIDFGTISAFFQLILAAIVGFIVYARHYISHFFHKIIRIFKKKTK